MKQKHRTFSNFQTISRNALASIIGGEEVKIVYIDGKPYVIKINGKGDPIYVPM